MVAVMVAITMQYDIVEGCNFFSLHHKNQYSHIPSGILCYSKHSFFYFNNYNYSESGCIAIAGSRTVTMKLQVSKYHIMSLYIGLSACLTM